MEGERRAAHKSRREQWRQKKRGEVCYYLNQQKGQIVGWSEF